MLARLRRAYEAFIQEPQSFPEELIRDEKWQILNKVMKSIHSWKLPAGDYLEFGVYKGMSFKHAYNLAQQWGHVDMRFYGFDSFEGLPDSLTETERGYNHFSPKQYSCSEKNFRDILSKGGVDLEKVSLIPGYYADSLTPELQKSLSVNHAAVVWIDVDLYQSAIEALEFVTPFIAQGTFLIFDDWFSFGGDSDAGEIQATNEWLASHRDIRLVEYHNFHTAGKAFLVQREKL
jgi:hypothetical protein